MRDDNIEDNRRKRTNKKKSEILVHVVCKNKFLRSDACLSAARLIKHKNSRIPFFSICSSSSSIGTHIKISSNRFTSRPVFVSLPIKLKKQKRNKGTSDKGRLRDKCLSTVFNYREERASLSDLWFFKFNPRANEIVRDKLRHQKVRLA